MRAVLPGWNDGDCKQVIVGFVKHSHRNIRSGRCVTTAFWLFVAKT